MKKLHFSLILSFLFNTCSTVNIEKLNKPSIQTNAFQNNLLEISFENLEDMKKDIEIDIDSIEYFSKNSYKFGKKYKFYEKEVTNNLQIEIPKGVFVGSIQVKAYKTIPFYKENKGIHTIYFGINEKRLKEYYPKEKCSPEVPYSIENTKSFLYSNFCDDLNTLDKKYNLKFTLKENQKFNPKKTFGLIFYSVSIGFSKIFKSYSFVPFLLVTSYFGIIQNEIEINSEILEDSL